MGTVNNKPTILFILHLPPPVHGAAMMGKYIHDSKLINESFDCHYINLTTAKNLQDIGKGGIKKLWRFAKLLRNIRKEMSGLRPQLVYVTPNAKGGAFYKDFIVVQMLKRMGCKVVVHYHNKGVATRQDRWLDDKLYKHFFKDIKVILLAEALYQDVKKYVKRENVFICPNGIPETLDTEPVAKRNNEIPHILFLSNLLISKGVLVLLDACKILKDKGYSFVCEFVGGETSEIDAARFNRKVDERGLNGMAVYKGRKYGDDKQEAFQNVDIFAFPTYYHNETFGLVNLEAMEYKLPVVSTDEGGIIDVVKDGENGLIAKKKNVFSLAEKLIALLGDEQLRIKMGEDGYRKFKQQFTLSAFEKNFADVLKNASGGVICNFVYFYGKKYGKDKDVFLRNTDILVFPTYYDNECFPLVLLEAMEYGLPCISTNEGGITAIIEDGKNGILVEKQNAECLANAMEALINDDAMRQSMGEEGRRLFKMHFTLPVFEKRIKDILEQALQK